MIKLFFRPALALWLSLGAVAAPQAGTSDPAAYQALMHGHLGEASTLLHRDLAEHRTEGGAHLLLCRTAIAEEQPDDAVNECLLAVHAAPNDAPAQMWLGRAFGLKASKSNPITGLKLAARVREAFERAVQLDPGDVHAVCDLAEYYITAPGIVGGDPQHARQLANGLLPHAPAQAHRLLGMLAHKDGDDHGAEAEFKQEIAASNTADSWSDLALFYVQNGDFDQTVAAVHKALELDARRGPVEVDAATILNTAKREREVAERALRAYLASNAQTDEAPVPRAHVILGKLLLKQGDEGGARAEFNSALSLAPNFPPAEKALGNL